MMKLAVALLFLGLDFYVYHYFATEESFPPRRPLTEFPLAIGDYRCKEREKMTREVELNLGVTDYLVCTYTGAADAEPGRRAPIVGVYVGYHSSQVRKEGGGSGENMIHPPAHCLPGSGWDIIASQRVPLDLPGLPGEHPQVNRLVIAKGEERQLVYYWYQERGRVIAADWAKIVDLFWDRATLRRTDGALVRITVPIPRNRENEAEQALLGVATEVVARLPEFVPN
jgi:EpsI family protein